MSNIYKHFRIDTDKLTELRLFWIGVPTDAEKDGDRIEVDKVRWIRSVEQFGIEWSREHLILNNDL